MGHAAPVASRRAVAIRLLAVDEQIVRRFDLVAEVCELAAFKAIRDCDQKSRGVVAVVDMDLHRGVLVAV